MINATMPATMRALVSYRVTRAGIEATPAGHTRLCSHGKVAARSRVAAALGSVRASQQGIARRAIVTNGAGNYAGWVQRFYHYRGFALSWRPLPAPWATACYRCRRQSGAPDLSSALKRRLLSDSGQSWRPPSIRSERRLHRVNNGCTGRFVCTREREYPGKVHGTRWSTPTLPRMQDLFGRTVRRSSPRKRSLQRSSVHSIAGNPRCSSCASIRKASRPTRR